MKNYKDYIRDSNKTMPQVIPCTPDAYQLMHEGLLAFTDATYQGMRVDTLYCKKQSKILNAKIKLNQSKFKKSETGKLWHKLFRTPNYNSGPQISTVLYDKEKGLGLQVIKETDKGNPSTDNEVIELFNKELPELKYFIKARKYEKILSTYLGNFIKETVDGVMHPGYSLHIPRSFRSSSQNPNFQNIPKRDKESKEICRRAIIPRKGHLFIEADFSGIEVAVSCCYHKDKKMLEYVKHPEKNNMHTDMAKQIYMLNKFKKEGSEKILRGGAKNGFVFPQFYGDYYGNNALSLASWGELPTQGQFNEKQGLKLMTGKTLGQHLIDKGINCFDDFLEHIKEVEDDFWNNRFRGYNQWKKNNVKEYYENGYLQMLTGFICSGLMSKNDINNYSIQGASFHLNLKTFITLNKKMKKLNMRSKLIGQIHDSIVVDAHPNEVDDLMSYLKYIACEWLKTKWKWINVPLEIEANIFEPDGNWASGSRVIKLRGD
jgi:DNA polymerase I